MNRFARIATLVLATTAPSTAAPAAPKSPHGTPKLSKAQAATVAKKALKRGTIVGSELEAEKGGSGLRYSFDVKDGATMREIGVDANTGAVLENVVEAPHPD